MELKTAIEILDYHQEWRVGKRENMIHEPKKLTEALDIVLSEIKKLLIHGVRPRSFYVVANSYETGEDLAQLSNALDSYEQAKALMNSKFNKERYPNAFIVSSLNEL